MTALTALADHSEVRSPWATLAVVIVGLIAFAALCEFQRRAAVKRETNRVRVDAQLDLATNGYAVRSAQARRNSTPYDQARDALDDVLDRKTS